MSCTFAVYIVYSRSFFAPICFPIVCPIYFTMHVAFTSCSHEHFHSVLRFLTLVFQDSITSVFWLFWRWNCTQVKIVWLISKCFYSFFSFGTTPNPQRKRRTKFSEIKTPKLGDFECTVPILFAGLGLFFVVVLRLLVCNTTRFFSLELEKL